MKKSCELCESTARIYCESDEANLCWDCDFNVHGANFLVAKHLRILLCHTCQSPTSWSATGAELGPTVSICRSCAAVSLPPEERETCQSEVVDMEDDGFWDGGSEEDEEESENKVVPGRFTSQSSPPLPTMTISSTSDIVDDDDDNECCLDLRYQEKLSCNDDGGNWRALKERRIEPGLDRTVEGRIGLIKETTNNFTRGYK